MRVYFTQSWTVLWLAPLCIPDMSSYLILVLTWPNNIPRLDRIWLLLSCWLNITVSEAPLFLILLDSTGCLEVYTPIHISIKNSMMLDLIIKMLIILIELVLDELQLVLFDLYISESPIKLILETRQLPLSPHQLLSLVLHFLEPFKYLLILLL